MSETEAPPSESYKMSDPSKITNAKLASRRRHQRVPGPFEGRRRGALTVSLHIHDLSVGGCLIQCYHEVPPGRRIKIDIELPYAGWITLEAETLYTRPDYGFAVKFVDVSEQTVARLDRVIQRLLAKSPGEE